MNEYLEEALDFYLGGITVSNGYKSSSSDMAITPMKTTPKPELKLWSVEP